MVSPEQTKGWVALREIVLDIETTGLFVHQGHRIIEVAAVELKNGKPTHREFHVYLNPDMEISAANTKLHGLTNGFLANKQRFPDIAKELRDFIGDSPVIITCRTGEDGYVLDKAFMNAELTAAGLPPLKDEQWVNVRRWSEALFGTSKATLNKVLDHYRIAQRHVPGALSGARLLAQAYPKLLKDYSLFLTKKKDARTAPKSAPPAP